MNAERPVAKQYRLAPCLRSGFVAHFSCLVILKAMAEGAFEALLQKCNELADSAQNQPQTYACADLHRCQRGGSH